MTDQLPKGFKRINVYDAEGKLVLPIEGKALWIARQCESGRHFTIHEQTATDQEGRGALVAIVPDGLILAAERNQ